MRIIEKGPTRLVVAGGSWVLVPTFAMSIAAFVFWVYLLSELDSIPGPLLVLTICAAVGIPMAANATLVWERIVFDKGIGRVTISRRRPLSRRVETIPLSAFLDARVDKTERMRRRGKRRRTVYRIVLEFELNDEGKGVPANWDVRTSGVEQMNRVRASSVPLTENSWTMLEWDAKLLATEIDVWMLRGVES
ncbi:MAG: hypothetical protein AAGC77_03545 [Pseudomonadota bacterium]